MLNYLTTSLLWVNSAEVIIVGRFGEKDQKDQYFIGYRSHFEQEQFVGCEFDADLSKPNLTVA